MTPDDYRTVAAITVGAGIAAAVAWIIVRIMG